MKKIILFVFGFAVFAGIGYFVYDTAHRLADIRSENSALKNKAVKNTDDITALNTRSYTLPHEAYSLRRLAYDPASHTLSIPELKVKVPYTEKARSLLYSFRVDEEGRPSLEADITTDAYMPLQEDTTLDCTSFLRIKIEDKQTPYNPAEKATSFKLEDGRILQVYSFTGNLEGNDQCKKSYDLSVSPSDYIEAFTGATSY